MPENYVLLERTELNASATSVTFANIPQTGYTDLKVVWSARYASGSGFALLDFNNLSTANFSNRVIEGTGASAISFVAGNTNYAGGLVAATDTANTFTNCELYIPNAFGSTAKSYSIEAVTENNGTTAYADMIAGLWNNTAAITAVKISTGSGAAFAANSTFSLYGIAALGTTPAIAPKASGGNVIATDGTYWYHAFLSSGAFVPQQGLTCDYLVVAGGGGGGYSDIGAGGGAGGLRSTLTATGGGGALESAIAVTNGTSYAITVGAGGVGNTSPSGKGSDSTFSSITSTGGGYGGARDSSATPGTGGSGGGAGTSGSAGTIIAGGAASPSGQGYAGGSSYGGTATVAAGGGGGGAGAVGNNASNGAPAAGGNGVLLTAWASPTSTGVSSYYGGGGGGANGYISAAGGTGGAGGGGAGARLSVSPVNGTANTGGGGGGGGIAGSSYFGGNGGSGIVIIRYPVA